MECIASNVGDFIGKLSRKRDISETINCARDVELMRYWLELSDHMKRAREPWEQKLGRAVLDKIIRECEERERNG